MYSITKLTSSGLVNSGRTELIAVILTSGGASASADILDGTDNSGTSKLVLKEATNNHSNSCYLGEGGAVFNTGIYVTLSGTGAVATLIWK